jgi:hypothetical protein
MTKLALASFAILIFISVRAQEDKFKEVVTPNGPRMYINEAYSNYKTKYFVLKKDSTGILVSSKIYLDDGKYYLSDKEESDSDHRLYADETIKISFQDQRNGQIFEGIARDSRWLFKIVSGKISLYSYYPPPDYLTNECINAFQVADGPIEYWTSGVDDLVSALEENKKAKSIFLKENNAKNNFIKGVEKFNKGFDNAGDGKQQNLTTEN